MAVSPTSNTLNKEHAQTVVYCQMCEQEPKLKWKCLECGLMMCQRCQDKIHPKFASADDHTVINIKEIYKHQAECNTKPDLTKLKCGKHTGNNYCVYCKTCMELVCQTCIAKGHKKHEFCPINDEYQARLEKIQQQKRHIEHNMQIVTEKEQKCEEVKSKETIKYETVKQEILNNESHLIDEIRKETQNLILELENKWEKVCNHLDDEKEQLRTQRMQTQQEINEIDNLFQPGHVKDVFENCSNRAVQASSSSVNTALTVIPQFKPGDATKLSSIIGKLKDVRISNNIQLIKEYELKTDLREIHCLVSCPDGSLWISDTHSEQLQNVAAIKYHLEVQSEFHEIVVFGAAVFSSGDLLLSIYGSSILKLVPFYSQNVQHVQGIVDSVYSVSPLQPKGVYVTRDDKVIVGANQEDQSNHMPPQVIIMDQSGQYEQVFLYDGHNKPLFTFPYSVCRNDNGMTAVLDILSLEEFIARVVILNKHGEIVNVYKGHPEVNDEDKPFMAFHMTTTPSNNFVIADYFNHMLHVLDTDGQNIANVNTEEIGLLNPGCLSFNKTGEILYVGQGHERSGNIFFVKNFIL